MTTPATKAGEGGCLAGRRIAIRRGASRPAGRIRCVCLAGPAEPALCGAAPLPRRLCLTGATRLQAQGMARKCACRRKCGIRLDRARDRTAELAVREIRRPGDPLAQGRAGGKRSVRVAGGMAGGTGPHPRLSRSDLRVVGDRVGIPEATSTPSPSPSPRRARPGSRLPIRGRPSSSMLPRSGTTPTTPSAVMPRAVDARTSFRSASLATPSAS